MPQIERDQVLPGSPRGRDKVDLDLQGFFLVRGEVAEGKARLRTRGGIAPAAATGEPDPDLVEIRRAQ